MSERKRFLALIVIMVVTSVAVTGLSMGILYKTAIEGQRERLTETARSQARLIEAAARFDGIYSQSYPSGPVEATLTKIRDAHRHYKGFGQTGEFTLARREGGRIVFLLSHRHYDLNHPKPVPWDSELAEPMKLALSGKSGTVIGLDYRAEKVLAAHEPVKELNLGIVAKIDLSEIQSPFIRAGMLVAFVTVLLVLSGAALFLKLSNPIIRRLERQNEALNEANRQLNAEIAERKRVEASLRAIEWLLEKPADAVSCTSQYYGDLTALNTERVILDSIGHEVLSDIVGGYLELLETSAAVYERNGDYAHGIFSSGWCRMLDSASRRLCNTDDNAEALSSGKWLCHESCWTEASRTAIHSGEPVDIQCHGGIRLYAVPIKTESGVAGAINFGYGDPPKDFSKLNEIAEKYNVDVDELKKEAECYESRPAFIVEIAKKRLQGSARLIGALIDSRMAQSAVQKEQEKLSVTLQSIGDGVITTDTRGRVVLMNKVAEHLTGWQQAEAAGRNLPEVFRIINEDTRNTVENPVERVLKEGSIVGLANHTLLIARDGKEIPIADSGAPILDRNNDVIGVVLVFQDQTIERHYQKQIKESERKFRLLVENSPDGIFVQTEERFAYLNKSAVELFGARSSDELHGTPILARFHPDYREVVRERIRLLNSEKVKVPLLEEVCLRMDGTPVIVEVSAVPLHYEGSDGALVFVRDITDRIEQEKAHDQLQEQLAQAQKMESVGRLAGGVAHDYNNALSVIIGYTEMLLDKLEKGSPLQEDLEEILSAANRSSDITRQLLAFARKQTISPKVLDLNETVEGMLRILRRLIGEDIDLAWLPGSQLRPVKMDPSQIDQILANLCVNARDAIAGVGKITIETRKVLFDEEYCRDHAGFFPGEYILLAVSDDGCGMDKETLSMIFEPFYTSKARGEGTGLGLSTVYGIVKQNDGFVNVYSEPGKGTTFKIYLPPYHGEQLEPAAQTAMTIPTGAGETVLLVEDEISILNLGKTMLESLGYHVLSAGNPIDTISLAKAHAGRIDLLITDVVMPEMNGRELSAQIQELYPDLKVLYMSGYTANVIAHHGVLEEGVHFMQKPFSKRELAARVREVLEEVGP